MFECPAALQAAPSLAATLAVSDRRKVSFMTKYVLAAASMMLALTSVACGGNDCDDAIDRIQAKAETCSAVCPEPEATDAECTNAAAEEANRQATAFEGLTCADVLANCPKAQ